MKVHQLEVFAPLSSRMAGFSTNCYIIENGACCVVIDPGFDPEYIASYLDGKGLSPSHIILTHGHFDHIGGIGYLKDRYECRLAVGEGDAYRLKEGFADILLKDGDEIPFADLSIKVMTTPGHTEGSLCLFVEDNIFSGDTLFCESVGRTDLQGGNFNTLTESLEKLFGVQGDFKVWPGHEETTTLSHERQFNPYVKR